MRLKTVLVPKMPLAPNYENKFWPGEN